jgi:hypothetical protein
VGACRRAICIGAAETRHADAAVTSAGRRRTIFKCMVIAVLTLIAKVSDGIE